ncbi:hypothetical protein PG985_008489 [Apiospora marii]|uniref:SAP domain-containing protein n=1 Tax=Apiospora marii TaxID=335849 RepID=A0ABR1SS39_9PEZI
MLLRIPVSHRRLEGIWITRYPEERRKLCPAEQVYALDLALDHDKLDTLGRRDQIVALLQKILRHADQVRRERVVVMDEAFDDAADGFSDETETSVVEEAFVVVLNVEEDLVFVEGAEELSVIADALVFVDAPVMARRLWWRGRIGVTSSMSRWRAASCGASAATVCSPLRKARRMMRHFHTSTMQGGRASTMPTKAMMDSAVTSMFPLSSEPDMVTSSKSKYYFPCFRRFLPLWDSSRVDFARNANEGEDGAPGDVWVLGQRTKSDSHQDKTGVFL